MKKWILASIVSLAAVAFFGRQADEPAPAQAVTEEKHEHDHVHVPAPQVAAPVSTPAPLARVPAAASTDELRSLETLGQTLAYAVDPAHSLNRLLEDMVKSQQQPLVVRDANPDTGEMMIVRTKSPLPGTRYFHGQYFTGEDGAPFVQHMSFEYKPGPDSMAAAVATVERSFPNLSRPVVQRPDYVKWQLDERYIIWVKKMEMDDLENDPFNSYSLDDKGTIRVAVELEIHH